MGWAHAVLVLAAAGGASAETCGGKPQVAPYFCGRTPESKGQPKPCDPSNLEVGNEIPFHVRIRNHASYETKTGETVYVAGKINAGSSVQVAFACLDDLCTSASGDALQFKRFQIPSSSTALTPSLRGVTFSMGRVRGSAGEGNKRFFNSGEMNHKGAVGLCSKIQNHLTACGHFSIANDVPLAANGAINLGVVYMMAVKALAQPFAAHAAGSAGMVTTVGGQCTPAERTDSGSGATSHAYFKGVAPLPKPPKKKVVKVATAPGAGKKKGKGKGKGQAARA